jgi:DNA polymerase III delta prime subunit
VALPGSDWIEVYLDYTDGIPAPEVFRLWAAISAVASALERRTWVEAARRSMFPNMFILLVGPPGTGKTEAIEPAKALLVEAKKFKIAPNSVTRASLVDTLREADRKIVLPDNQLVEYHSLCIALGEFGVLISANDLAFLSVLNELFDNPPAYRERRRHFEGGKEQSITRPQLNIVAGVQPLYLSSLLPDEAWGQGFTSRLIMIYADAPVVVPLFGGQDRLASAHRPVLVRGLGILARLMGRWYWDSDAARELARWHRAGFDPAPMHSKLEYYNSRRVIHILKLCIVSAASRCALHVNGTPEMRIRLLDVTRARDWLLHAESLMPDIFRGMVYKTDVQVIKEMHYFMWQKYATKREAIHEATLLSFLSAHGVGSEKVLRVLEVAERSGVIQREAGSKLYKPRPLNEHGLA